ncbi:MAG: hypothetical protein J0M19_06840 [Sphingomonadales bacterium]|nr:hypothetical protein [Sphingomonadales bacterium]
MLAFCKTLGFFAFIAVWCSVPAAAQTIRAGERLELRLEYKSEYAEDGQSSGSARGHQSVILRVIADRDGGHELEYGLPDTATDRDRLREWQLPARIFLAADGTVSLLNPAELEVRRDRFLKAIGVTAEACGRWIFTWNAFKIECDPQSVLRMLKQYELQPRNLAEGTMFSADRALGSAPIQCRAGTTGEKHCTVTLPLDPDGLRRELAETDVAVGEMTGAPVGLDEATRTHAATHITGTITITFDLAADGAVTRKTTVTKVQQRKADGRTRTSISTRILTGTRL